MATKTFASNKSSLFADGSSNLGGGADNHLPVGGPWNGYTFRSAIRFALDFSGVKAITSAVLNVKTSSAVHVGFSSDPDIYVARATADWTANSSSSSSDGGSGWSTSPTVYPGPASTTGNRVSKDITTAEQTWVAIDITGIVRDWMGGQPNYGVLMYYVASGDVTEFNSYRSSTPPTITLTYSTDTPPVATITGPTGTTTSKRPTITGTATDVDGDAITAYGVEVLQGATVVHSVASTGSGASLAYVPTADLPSGNLTAHIRAQAAGVWSAWSADTAFTIDRPPVTNTPTAPTGNVSGNRRPVITFTASDPDSDPVEMYDVNVYATSGGVATGSPVYSKASQTGGISGYTVNHTPTADLPPGPLVVRARVRARSVWSGWSGDKAFTIVTANPSISWVWPPTPGGPLLIMPPLPAPGTAWSKAQVRVQAEATAPAGYTLSTFTRTVVRIDGTGAPYTVLSGADAGAPGKASYFISVPWTFDASASGATWRGLYVTFEITLTATSSNGGSTTEVRRARVNLLEWQGAIYLGDNVTALSVAEAPPAGNPAPPLDINTTWYRAQVSKTAPNGAAPWRLPSAIATVRAELPAQGAYLGTYVRSAAQADDVDRLDGYGSFEDIAMPGWRPWGSWAASVANGGAPDGARVLRITGNGSANWPGLTSFDIPVVNGGSYQLAMTVARRGAGTANCRARVDYYKGAVSAGKSFSVIGSSALNVWTLYTTAVVALPSDGSVDNVRVLLYIDAAPAAANDIWEFDAVTLIGPDPSASGFDRIDVNWTSAG